MKRAVIAFAIGLIATMSVAQDAEAPVSSTSLDPVLVTGEQPGPGLWRVTKVTPEGEHTLWVLGSYGPLPQKVMWRSQQVEDAIAQSQEVLGNVRISVDADVGFFGTLAALPSMINIADNPDGAKLQEVVPPDVYAKWAPLKAKYVGRDNDIEERRPTFAIEALSSKAREKLGLANPAIWPTVVKIAKKHRIKVTDPEIEHEIKVSNPRAMIKKFKKVQLADVECFSRSLDRFEGDLDTLMARANAWAIGDVQKLRRLPNLAPNENCMEMLRHAVMNGSLAEEVGAQDLIKQGIKLEAELRQRAATEWLALAEAALARNKSTFAVLNIGQALEADGYLEQLKAKGYTVVDP